MAHVAKLDDKGIVSEIHVIDNEKLPNDGQFNKKVEDAVIAYQKSLGLDGNWKMTSYNNNFRGKYACVGDKYDSELDLFVSPVGGVDPQVLMDQIIAAQRDLAAAGMSPKDIEMATGHPCFDEFKNVK